MSKTNDTSRPATLEDHCPLADSELDAVSGGIIPGLNNMIADKTGEALGDLLVDALAWLGQP
jgi:hypothetical protein